MKSNVDGHFGDNVISQVYLVGQLLDFASGDVVPADGDTVAIEGITMEEIPATDDRYTTAGQIQYDRVKEGDELEIDVTGAALSTAVKGTRYTLSDSQTVDLSDTTTGTSCLMFVRPGQGGRGVFAVVRRQRATSA